MQKRILIITDSLGCPRPQISPSETWTEKIISKYKEKALVYTYCVYGLKSTDIPFNWIDNLKPDIIISQFGICDACRRACPENILKVFERYRKIGQVYQGFASEHHFCLTRIWNMHYTDVRTFEEQVKRLSLTRRSCIAFVPIAPPGDYLIGKTYGVISDVKEYNRIFSKFSKRYNVSLLPVYDGVKADDIIIEEDGHHLNGKGHELVYNAVSRYIDERICDKK